MKSPRPVKAPKSQDLFAQDKSIHAQCAAKCLSKDLTQSPIEVLLGGALRWVFEAKQADSVFGKYRNKIGFLVLPQMKYGPYSADFAVVLCHKEPHGRPSVGLIAIECDGHKWHEKSKRQAARDKARDRWFTRNNIPFLRFTGSEVYADPLGCAEESWGVVKNNGRHGMGLYAIARYIANTKIDH